MRYENIVDGIGATPLVRLRLPGAVYAKLEMYNPFGMKDRVARETIQRARQGGELNAGDPIVESSSGTMALGVALVGTALGHDVHIVTDPRIDQITLTKLRALGAQVHIVERMTRHGWQSARLELLDQLMRELPGAFCPRQYSNPNNPLAYRALAAELLEDLGPFDVLVGSVGSGGSLCGSARALREVLPGLWVVGVDCVGSVLFGQPDRPQRLQSGLGNSLVPPNLDHELVNEVHWLNDREAYGATMSLAREQKLFGGNSSGSVYRVLGHLAERLDPATRVVGLLPDRGDRYTHTVYDRGYWQEKGLSKLPEAAAPQQVPPGTTVTSWAYTFTSDRAAVQRV